MQQINLYLPEFQPNREPLRSIHMLWGGLAFFILLLLFTLFSSFQNQKLAVQLQQEQQALQGLKNQLQLLTVQKPMQAGPELDAKLAQLQSNLQRHQQIMAVIAHQNLGNDKGFSAHLAALGQASMDSISLETFSLQQGGTYAELTGKTRSADQVPLYLQKLRANTAFANVGFGVLNLERDKETGALKFSLERPGKTKNPSGGDTQ